MSQAWSGNISTDDATICIEDVQIRAPSSSTAVPIPWDAKLHFLSLVEVARIPFYLAAGPSCDVSTSNEATSRWLEEALLDYEETEDHGHASREPWWSHSGMQSENGILLRVETGNKEEHGTRNDVTEMLLYAAVAKTGLALPSHPASSSPTSPHEEDLQEREKAVKVFALPLCSNIIGLAKTSMGAYQSKPAESQSAHQACFLPYTYELAQATQAAPQKRQSISTLFEDATQKRKKLKVRGGESVSQAMAGIDRLPSQQGIHEKLEVSQPLGNDLKRRSVSRRSSMAGPEPSRPTSRSEPLANGKRSSLHRVESIASLRDKSVLSDADGSYAQQNKAALTRVVMAAMRLHGLQQKKKPPSKSLAPKQATFPNTTDAIVGDAEDEYKLVYHQTFKAAIFTFRKHLSVTLVTQEMMRDAVDRLLTIFCSDPMIVDHGPNGSESFESMVDNGLPTSSPFDKPSSQARSSNAANDWSTPTVKKR